MSSYLVTVFVMLCSGAWHMFAYTDIRNLEILLFVTKKALSEHSQDWYLEMSHFSSLTDICCGVIQRFGLICGAFFVDRFAILHEILFGMMLFFLDNTWECRNFSFYMYTFLHYIFLSVFLCLANIFTVLRNPRSKKSFFWHKLIDIV